jgi:glycosyltransferase involved in cell wall biosynthesis
LKVKILWIAHFFEASGWSKASIDYVLALDSVGVDVVPRPYILGAIKGDVPARIRELMNKSAEGCDTVVQNVLPHLLDFNGKLHNVALYASETSDFRTSAWADRLNCMDEIIVINPQMVEAARRSGVTRPITVVPHAVDVARFERSYPILDTLKQEKEQGNFLFYTIGEFVRRKNFAALLKAYYLEFDQYEPVKLVIKTSQPGFSPAQCLQNVQELCSKIKEGLKLRSYPSEIIMTERLSEERLMSLHQTCDVFVQPSYGEAFSLPALDAMAMGKTPIVSNGSGYLLFVGDDTGWLVNCHEENVFGAVDTFEDLFVGTETWHSADVSHLRKCMREAFGDVKLRETKAAVGISRTYDFSYENIGSQLKKALCHGQALD